jgi:hypothetical protein
VVKWISFIFILFYFILFYFILFYCNEKYNKIKILLLINLN